ncbi:hypothetical protein [uncultured Tenacibaculum sp.]|uniref:hypothetical protein n=1 Tax=uncultured Tenacibaculum sp. TaxID=174713 RepID=UPI00262B2BA5|nr:hypothetical protein [uncultured Tenacibaculum sp.]
MGDSYFNIKEEDHFYYKKLITERFLYNPRMSLLFSKEKKDFNKKVFHLISYCFSIAVKQKGVYVSNNKKTIVLFYEQEKFRKSLGDYIRFFNVIKSISFLKLKRVLKNEKEVKEHKLKLSNYIYVWFIAQDKNYKKLDGLVEINKMLFDLARKRKLPILFETSDYRLLNFYKKAGFDIYNQMVREGEIIYFFADKLTCEKHKKNS